nr:unnamed protein product [Callosobruchus analis]
MEGEKARSKHPRDSASLISKIFFCWILPILQQGYRIPVDETGGDASRNMLDLPGPMQSHISCILGKQLEEAWQEQCNASDKPSLYKAIWRVFGKQILACGIMTLFIEFVFKLITPMCLLKLIEYYEPHQMSMTEYDAFLYSIGIIAATFLNVVSSHHYMLGNLQLGMKIRVACSSLVYRKALKLSKGDAEVGKLVKFLSNDVTTFDSALMFVHVIWAAPLQVLVISILTVWMLGIHPLWGTALFAFFMGLQVYFGKLLTTCKEKADKKTEKRISVMCEIISGIQVIKMYAWEMPFYKLIEKIRRAEMKQVRSMALIRGIFGSFKLFLSQSALFLAMLGYTISGHIPTAIYVFTITSFFNVVRQTTVASVPTAVTTMTDAKVSIQRITQFLTGDEVSPSRITASFKFTAFPKESAITFLGVSAKWHRDQAENTLNAFDLKIQRNETVAIIGKVGSGKSTLLQVILNEVPSIDGIAHVDGAISYAAQEPWIFPGSIRENIIFRQEFNEVRYIEVCKACALSTDFDQLPDTTILEEKGISSSIIISIIMIVVRISQMYECNTTLI